ncbi:hypothetical protein C8R44DRAFT_770335 [Mycena epipterygia]|nr:hypothetical protein C8R44DRAFT_770335 [Mycena epipterygia]
MSSIFTHLFSLSLSSKASNAILFHALAAGFQAATFVASTLDNHTSTTVTASKSTSRMNSPSKTIASNEHASLSLSSTLIYIITSASILLAILNAKSFFSERDISSDEDPDPANDTDPPLFNRARVDSDGQPPPPPPQAATSSDARKRHFNWWLWFISFILLVSAAVLCYYYQADIVKLVKSHLIKHSVYKWLGPRGHYSTMRWIVDKCLDLAELRHVPLWIHIPVVVLGTYLILLASYLWVVCILWLLRRKGLRVIGLAVVALLRLRWTIPILCFIAYVIHLQAITNGSLHLILRACRACVIPLWEFGSLFTLLAGLHVLHPLVATVIYFPSSLLCSQFLHRLPLYFQLLYSFIVLGIISPIRRPCDRQFHPSLLKSRATPAPDTPGFRFAAESHFPLVFFLYTPP